MSFFNSTVQDLLKWIDMITPNLVEPYIRDDSVTLQPKHPQRKEIGTGRKISNSQEDLTAEMIGNGMKTNSLASCALEQQYY